MNTIDAATQTAQLEGYDQSDFVNARNQAIDRRHSAWERETAIRAKIATLEYDLEQACADYSYADRACNLFENAQFDLNEWKKSSDEFEENA